MAKSFAVSVFLGFVLFEAVFAAEKFEGRWDLTERDGTNTFASWLEITRDNNTGWKGRFLHRGGHAMPARIESSDDILHVTMLPDEDSRVRPNAKWPTLTARLEEGRLEGRGTDRRGNTFTWTGVRSPDRLEGSDREVKWGDPVPLFNGKDLSGWKPIGGRPSQWQVADGILVNEATGANLQTVDDFRDFKLHIEFKIPQGSNSGIYLRGRYETQVMDDYGQEPHSRRVGGIYGLLKPAVNASKPAGEWNTVDVTLIGYRVTMIVNDQMTIDRRLIDGITGGALDSKEEERGPIMLQGDHGPVYYRNIVLTPGE